MNILVNICMMWIYKNFFLDNYNEDKLTIVYLLYGDILWIDILKIVIGRAAEEKKN